ncbi:RNA-binding S4 domain-containing protein [Denitratisoma oestradiolicum]|uniref:Uncharacterized protein n=1 Tax=Denitratisoma oestradiolicum TaxID=311182 RepID=A0A6S6XZM2_9PROT|nr:RNA-binding S4 domain-containing protein [Denitratisoma oestradiolicum]TWO79623.1 RNA-binding protein [Denitratisoma oestradiolicum]CAB1370423.1 conserved protein of unknown function [Denitratisoma oestradiolicum]
MPSDTFQLHGEFIELHVLLKLQGLAGSGGEAKALIAGGQVSVDGQPEIRKGRKLRGGEVVRLGDAEIRIIATA